MSFVAKSLPAISAAWLNAVDILKFTIFADATTKAAARAALTSDAPMAVGEGGTGATTAGAARTALGSTTVGDAVFIAITAAAGRTALDVAQNPFVNGQVAFPATQIPSTDVNTLDDYQEGTWSPTVGGTTELSVGEYVKIGKFVFIRGNLTITTIGPGDVNTITGLPFVVSGTAVGSLAIGYFTGLAASVVNITGIIASAFNSIEFYHSTAAATAVTQGTLFSSGTQIIFSGCYQTTG